MIAKELARRLSEPAPVTWSAEPGKPNDRRRKSRPTEGAWIAKA